LELRYYENRLIRALACYRFEILSFAAVMLQSVLSGIHEIAQVFQDIIVFLTFIILLLTIIKMVAQGLEKHFKIDFFHFLRKNDRKKGID
jgi:hypothetical protein